MKDVTLKINGNQITVPRGTSIYMAAAKAGISIPSLCRHEDLEPKGACGMCIVQIQGQPGFKRSCVTPVEEGMEVFTTTAAIRDIRRGILELVLAAHPADCLQCIKHGKCELQTLAEWFEIRSLRYDRYTRDLPVDASSFGIVRDMNKCIGCGKCVQVCNEVQTVASIFFHGRGSNTIVSPAYGSSMGQSVCVNCGQCVVYCPVGALYEKEAIEEVWKAIDDPQKIVVAQIAPSVRVAIGEEFGLAPGELTIGKLYSALRALGIDVVFDTNFSADLTIMEEATEFLQRLKGAGPFPLITSCSPGWIKFGETFFPDLMENVSSCKSPLLSRYTGAATIFGASGGVMEAALRTAYEMATGKTLEKVDFTEVRGMAGVKEAKIDVGGTPIKVAVTNGLGNARKLLERVEADKKAGHSSYHFIEIMACAGDCVGGGGQPIPNTLARRASRIEGLYREDRGLPFRKSHLNPEIKGLYAEYLGTPGSERAHALLHTHYTKREQYMVVPT